MEVVALISGGKDSCYSIMHCLQQGLRVVALANIHPETDTDLDSFMYQSVGHEAIQLISQATDLPLYQITTKGHAKQKELFYEQTESDEIEDLYSLLLKVKDVHPNIKAVSSGAILSNYQRLRVENVCSRLGLISLAFLWQLDQKKLLHDMIASGTEAILIKIGSLGLEIKKHLGRPLSELEVDLYRIGETCDLNVCGEGGEYESLTLDAPFFKKRVVIDKSEIVVTSNDNICPVAYLKITQLHLEEKIQVNFPQIPIPPLLSNKLTQFDNIQNSHLSSPKECTVPIKGGIHGLNCIRHICLGKEYFCVSAVAISEGGGIEEGVNTMMQLIDIELSKHDCNWSQVIHSNLFVNNLEHFTRINKVYSQKFHIKPPSRVCIQIPSPPNTISRLDLIGFRTDSASCMHVQSRSYWAPENIGPYSQCYATNSLVFTAGQIGLIPSEMVLSHSAIQPQLSLQHCQTILHANQSDVTCYLLGSCYGVSRDILEHCRQVLSGVYCVGKLANHVAFVLVPKLPKSAECEWHFIASKRETYSEFDKIQTQIDGSESTSFLTYFSSQILPEKALTVHFCLKQDPKEFSFETLTFDLSQTLLKISKTSSINSNSVTAIRVWTVLRCLNLEQLITDWLRVAWCEVNIGTQSPVVCVYETDGILFSQKCVLVLQAIILP